MIHYLFKPFFKEKKKETASEEERFYRELEIDVLARTIFGEARGEPLEGMEAVASVVLNRVRIAQKKNGYWWGKNIIGVCQKPYQFSCWNKTDPSYKRLTSVTNENKIFRTCLKIAEDAVDGCLWDCTGSATHYHADYVSPYWSRGEKPTKIIGRHIFYKLVDG
ncbi:MAG: cell wall hydrolase [Pseudomonadota bacterium]